MEICSVLQFEGPNDVMVWKSPHVDFNTASQLIVHETQDAIFFRDGRALDLFGPGRYSLSTQNIPLLSKLINLPFDGVSPFHCEVYFVNKVEEMAIRWGTDQRVQYMDPEFNLPLSVGCNGEMTLTVKDSRKLLLKLVGTEPILTQDMFVSYMRSIINQKIKPYLAQKMVDGGFSIFEVDAHLEEMSRDMFQLVAADFDDYGVELRRFMLLQIAKPLDNPDYQRIVTLKAQQNLAVQERLANQKLTLIDATTDAQADKITTVVGAEADAQAEALMGAGRAERRRQEGYTYQEERSFDVAQGVAANEAMGEFTNIGVGLGMISGIGGSLSGGVSQMATEALGGVLSGKQAAPITSEGIADVGAGIAGVAGAVGAQQQASGAQGAAGANQGAEGGLGDFKARVQKLKILKDEGLIDEAEFEAQKSRILSEI